MARSLNQSFFNNTALLSTLLLCTRVQRCTMFGVLHNSVHLLTLIPLSQYLNEEGVASGDLRSPFLKGRQGSTFDLRSMKTRLKRPTRKCNFLLLLLLFLLHESKTLSHFQDVSLRQVNSHFAQDFYLLLVSPIIICPQMCKISTSLKFPPNKLYRAVQCTIVSSVFEKSVCLELEIAECG